MPSGIYPRKNQHKKAYCKDCNKPLEHWYNKFCKSHSKIGTRNPMFGKDSWNKGKKCPQLSDKNHHRWKGDEAGYDALHDWVKRRLGKPKYCEFCKTTSATHYDWSNKSGKYLRDLSDWQRLCKKCHNLYDNIYGKVWAVRKEKYGPSGQKKFQQVEKN